MAAVTICSDFGAQKDKVWHCFHCWRWRWSRSVMSDSLWPRELYPTMLLHPWESPGKNTGVGYHFLLRGSSRPRDWTWVSCIGGRRFNLWATREAQQFPLLGRPNKREVTSVQNILQFWIIYHSPHNSTLKTKIWFMVSTSIFPL